MSHKTNGILQSHVEKSTVTSDEMEKYKRNTQCISSPAHYYQKMEYLPPELHQHTLNRVTASSTIRILQCRGEVLLGELALFTISSGLKRRNHSIPLVMFAMPGYDGGQPLDGKNTQMPGESFSY